MKRTNQPIVFLLHSVILNIYTSIQCVLSAWCAFKAINRQLLLPICVHKLWLPFLPEGGGGVLEQNVNILRELLVGSD